MTARTALWKQLVFCCVLLALAGFAWKERAAIARALGIGESSIAIERKKRDRRAPVIVATTAEAKDDLSLDVVGTGRAKRSVVLRSEVAGLIATAPILERAVFKKGEELLTLDSRKEGLAISLARTRLADAERSRKRISSLRSRGAVAAMRVDETETAARLAKIELDQAREQYGDRRIVAPFDGVVGLTDVEIGAWIDSNDEIAIFDDRSEIFVEFDLPEALMPRVSVGMIVAATTPSAPGRAFEGNVQAIDSRVDAGTRSIKVRVAIPNQDDVLRPGASFSVRLDLAGKSYVKAPELALQFSRSSLFVWRVRDGKVERAAVRLVRRLDGAALIEGDVQPGDQVVVEGAQRLTPGKSVRLMQRADG